MGIKSKMLIILTWHQIIDKPHAVSIKNFEKQLKFLKQNFPIVKKPNEIKDDLSILLTFDDATVDFYTTVYPLLVDYSIPATLAVPTGWIQDSSQFSVDERLAHLKSRDPFHSKECFCTKEELQTLFRSPLIELAAHGHEHLNLEDHPDVSEIEQPIQFFEKTFQKKPNTFIFPYGKYSKKLLPLLKANYSYLFRIGSSTNSIKNPTFYYRIVVDHISNIETLFHKFSLLKFICKERVNRLRNR
jgi:peptidoglycan/xylan/chitin deacetylase (PgdA/CDA1 family)